jgi:hypothetical protein
MADSCRKHLQTTIETGKSSYFLTAVRLPVTRKVITRAMQFEKRLGKLFLFVEPEPELARPKSPDYNVFRLDRHGCIVSVIISPYPYHEWLLGYRISHFFPNPNEANDISDKIKATQTDTHGCTVQATFQIPGCSLQKASCRITPFLFFETLITIKEIINEID